MGTAFAGIVRVPMTSVIMIFEITRDYSIIVPLMISNPTTCAPHIPRRMRMPACFLAKYIVINNFPGFPQKAAAAAPRAN
jgi:voltage-gated chloride channel